MDADFTAAIARAAALRLTEWEMVDQAGVARATYWRAREGRTGTAPRVKVLRLIEAHLAAVEKERTS